MLSQHRMAVWLEENSFKRLNDTSTAHMSFKESPCRKVAPEHFVSR